MSVTQASDRLAHEWHKINFALACQLCKLVVDWHINDKSWLIVTPIPKVGYAQAYQLPASLAHTHWHLFAACQSHIGICQSHIGMCQADIGMCQSSVGMCQSPIDMCQSHFGMCLSCICMWMAQVKCDTSLAISLKHTQVMLFFHNNRLQSITMLQSH